MDTLLSFLDYIVLGIMSLAMFIYAYKNRPVGDDEGDDSSDDGGGGPSVSGDAAPLDRPPGLSVRPSSMPDQSPQPTASG
ncbi:hypothetical protein [Salisaeta longa]|uniref:hypothetical protein n=1 Tax=Salisaeta longa TaxID=503170 RepID=UPI0003B3221A|nr:hypothetical protein [Salisaeta longa]